MGVKPNSVTVGIRNFAYNDNFGIAFDSVVSQDPCTHQPLEVMVPWEHTAEANSILEYKKSKGTRTHVIVMPYQADGRADSWNAIMRQACSEIIVHFDTNSEFPGGKNLQCLCDGLRENPDKSMARTATMVGYEGVNLLIDGLNWWQCRSEYLRGGNGPYAMWKEANLEMPKNVINDHDWINNIVGDDHVIEVCDAQALKWLPTKFSEILRYKMRMYAGREQMKGEFGIHPKKYSWNGKYMPIDGLDKYIHLPANWVMNLGSWFIGNCGRDFGIYDK